MAGTAVPTELEAKLLVPSPADLRAIARLTQVGPHPLRRRDTVRLHSVYLDTPEYALARHGVAFRLRRTAGRWEATVKWAGHVNGTVHERPELTVPLERPPQFPFVLPDGPLRVHLAALVAGRALAPILVSEVRRQRIDVLPPLQALPDGPPVAELALDRVRLRAPEGDGPEDVYCEAEIECTGGERRDVVAVSRLLRRAFHLMPSRETKFARGLVLVRGRRQVRAATGPVRVSDSMAQVARKIVARHLERLRRYDPGTRLGDDPEALHDMRVATRRLRAALRAFNPAFSRRLDAYLREALQWLGRLLGGVRDLDVQLSNLKNFGALFPPGQRPGVEPFQAYLEQERAARRNAMLEGLDSERYYELVRELERFAGGSMRSRSGDPSAHEPIGVAGRRAIKKAFRRLLKRGAKIPSAPAPEDLHALRIRAKRVRYLLEFLRELTGKAGRRLIKQLVQLQDLLGAYHDAVVAADFVRLYVEGATPDVSPSNLLALGALVGSDLRLAEHKRSEFQHTWQRFARKRTVNDLQEVLRQLRADVAPTRVLRRPTPPRPSGQEQP
jgi:inorganic triphosphatase YgiF